MQLETDAPDSISKEQLAAYVAVFSASTLLSQRIDRDLRDDGNVTHANFEVLAALASNPEGLRMTDLATRLVVSRSGLSYQVSTLEKLGFVSRTKADGGDPRTVIAQITSAGAALVQRLMPGHIALLHTAFFSQLSSEELTTLTKALARIADGLRQGAGS